MSEMRPTLGSNWITRFPPAFHSLRSLKRLRYSLLQLLRAILRVGSTPPMKRTSASLQHESSLMTLNQRRQTAAQSHSSSGSRCARAISRSSSGTTPVTRLALACISATVKRGGKETLGRNMLDNALPVLPALPVKPCAQLHGCGTAWLAALPYELRSCILLQLRNSPAALAAAARSCRALHQVFKSDALWKRICFLRGFAPVWRVLQANPAMDSCNCKLLLPTEEPCNVKLHQICHTHSVQERACLVIWGSFLFTAWKAVWKQNILIEQNWNRGHFSMSHVRPHANFEGLIQAFTDRWAVMVVPGQPGMVLDLKSDGNMYLALDGLNGLITAVTFSYNSKFVVAVGGANHIVKVWNLTSRECEATFGGHTTEIFVVQMNDDIIVTGSLDCSIRVHDAQNHHLISILEGHASGVYSLQISGPYLVSGSNDHTIRLWNWRTGVCIHTVSNLHTACVYALHIHNDHIVSGDWDGKINLLDLATLTPLRTFESQDAVLSVFYDGVRLVSSGGDGNVNVWNLETGKRLYGIRVHEEAVWAVKVEGVGRLVTSGFDKQFLLLDFSVIN